MTRAEEIARSLYVADACASEIAAALESYAREEREREVDAAAKWLIARGYSSAGEALRRDRPTPTIAARIREGQ